MKKITVTFDELHELSPAELKGGIVAFTESRDRYAKEGKKGLADLFATLLIALVEERDRRKREWEKTKSLLRKIDGVDYPGEAEWS